MFFFVFNTIYLIFMIDRNGYRLNVGIILVNCNRKLFWGKRVNTNGWQFPQGGVDDNETLEQTMYRELTEEIGLTKKDVKVLGITKKWVSYKLPLHFRRRSQGKICIGQKQKWFLLLLSSDESNINLKAGGKPEFSSWKWVDYWEPRTQVIYFKMNVYYKVLSEFAPIIEEVEL